MLSFDRDLDVHIIKYEVPQIFGETRRLYRYGYSEVDVQLTGSAIYLLRSSLQISTAQ